MLPAQSAPGRRSARPPPGLPARPARPAARAQPVIPRGPAACQPAPAKGWAAAAVAVPWPGAGGLAAPLLRRTISGLTPDDRQGEVLEMFASIETVCQLSAGVVYNGLFELTSAFFPEAFGCLAALSELGCAACARAFARGKARAGYRAPLGARACDALCFAESVRAVK